MKKQPKNIWHWKVKKDKKVLFLISSELFHRNYVKTGVLEFLGQNYPNLVVLASKEVSPINHKNLVRYEIDEQNENRHYQFLRILGWRYRHRSRSFRFRLFKDSQLKFDFRQADKSDTIFVDGRLIYKLEKKN